MSINNKNIKLEVHHTLRYSSAKVKSPVPIFAVLTW